MRGAPNTYMTRQDIENGLRDWPDETKAFLQQLLDDRYCIVSSEELPEGEVGRNEPPLYRSETLTTTDDEGNVISQVVRQGMWREDENAALFRLGLSVQEAEQLIGS